MFTKTITSTFIAAAVTLGAFGAVAATSSSASAEVRGGIWVDGAGISVGFGDRRYRDHRGPRFGGWDRPRRDRWHRYNQCNPRKAVRKARRKGIRHAHVVRVGGRGVIVAGRKWGERVVIGFRGNHRCSVRFVRAD